MIKYFSHKHKLHLLVTLEKELQSRTKLLEKVFPIMSTFLRNKTISKTTPLRKENPFPQFNVASHKCPGIRLSFEYITTLLLGEGGEGRTGTATMFTKMPSKYTVFSTVLSKIVACFILRYLMLYLAFLSLRLHRYLLSSAVAWWLLRKRHETQSCSKWLNNLALGV